MIVILYMAKTKCNIFYTLLTINNARMTQHEEEAIPEIYLSFITKDLE